MDGIRKEVAAEGGSVLLLSGGDINTGVPESDLQDAEPDFRGMNLIGYDAMAVGNHEFDNPLSVLRQQEKWAKFPFLSANIYQKSTGERLFKPWALFKRGGLNIAVIGLTTDDTAKIGNPEFFTDIEFRKPAEEAKLVIQSCSRMKNRTSFWPPPTWAIMTTAPTARMRRATSRWRAACRQVRWR